MAKPPALSIRRATDRDLGAIARVLVDTWRDTFRGLIPDSFLDAMSYGDQEERHRRRLRQPENLHLVLEDAGGGIVGFANAGRNRLAEYPYSTELYAIYIGAAHQGLGLGRRLLGAVAGAGLERGRTQMLVQALEVNPCRAFYDRLGARRLGTRSLSLGEFSVPAIDYGWEDLSVLTRPQRIGREPEAGRPRP